MRKMFFGSLLCALIVLVSVAVRSQAPASQVKEKPAVEAKQAVPWLRAEKLANGVWCIHDSDSDNMYLVEGTQKALLIDTGLGYAKLSDFVKTLTSKPVTVVNTHGHRDHAGGNYQFKSVYADPADMDAVKQLSEKGYRSQIAADIATAKPATDFVSAEQLESSPEPKLLPVKDGFIFDLGARKLEVIEVPGHTPGEIVLLDSANKLVFTGDHDNMLVWLFLPTSLPLDVYVQSLRKLQKREAEFTTIYPGHGGPLPASFVGEQIACVDSILDGSAKSEPQHYFAGDAMVARYKMASVAYDPNKIKSKK